MVSLNTTTRITTLLTQPDGKQLIPDFKYSKTNLDFCSNTGRNTLNASIN